MDNWRETLIDVFIKGFDICAPFLIPSLSATLTVLYFLEIIAFTTLKLGLLGCIVLFVILPLIYRYSYNFQRSTVFLSFVNVPKDADYTHPDKYVKGSRNLYIQSEDASLGLWQILPDNINSSQTNDNFFDKILNNGQNVVIYNHGNGGTRLSSHRLELYKVLRKSFHVIAFDYRGYGDSSKLPQSELELVEDILSVYQWVRNKTQSNIFIWGHSLGTSLSTHALMKIQSMNLIHPIGLILESPFNNMREEICEFPLAQIWRFLPWFDVTIAQPVAENFRFETDKYICQVDVPIMILHAEDDHVVPFKLGVKLYEAAKRCRSPDQGQVDFIKFASDKKFGHKYICRAVDLPDKINNFIQLALETKAERQYL